MHLWSDWERSESCMVSARRSQMNWLHWRPKRAMNRPAVQNGGAKVAMKGEPRSRGVDALDGTKMGSWVGLTESRRTTTKSLGYYAYPHYRRSLGQFVSHGQGIEIQKRRASAHFTSELTLSIIHAVPCSPYSLNRHRANTSILYMACRPSGLIGTRQRSSRCQYPIVVSPLLLIIVSMPDLARRFRGHRFGLGAV